MEKLDFKQGQYVFRAGDGAGYLFLLIKGEIGIFLPTNETKEPNFPVGENEIFGLSHRKIDTAWPAISNRIRSNPKYVELFKHAFDDVNDYYIWKNMEKLLTFNLRYSISQELTNMLLGLNSDTIISIVDFRYQYTVVSNGNSSHQSGGKYSEATLIYLSLIHISEPTRLLSIS